jgi:hypothetical protein
MKLLNMPCLLVLLLSVTTRYSEPKFSFLAPISKYFLLYCSSFIKRYHLWVTPCGVVTSNKVISEKGIGNEMEGSAHGTI